MTQICRNCGSQTSRDSVFCEQCGSKLLGGSSKSSPVRNYISSKPQRKKDPPPQFYSSPYKHSSLRRPIIFGFVAVFFIVVISGALFLALIANDTSYEHLGGTFAVFERQDYEEMAEVEFIIDNSVGMVEINFRANDSDNLVIIERQVYGPSGSSLGESNMFEVQEIGNRTLFIFNSWNPYTSTILNYDIFIQVSTMLQASFDVQVITGEIMFQTEEPSTLKDISLETTTGGIHASFKNTRFLDSNTINRLNTVTGSIDAYFTDIISEGDLHWNIETVSGSIYSGVDQYDLPERNATYYLDLKAVTGEIVYQFDFNDSVDIGYFLDANIVTGQTSILGFSSSIDLPYTSPNFNMATLNFVSTFETTTGSITVIKS